MIGLPQDLQDLQELMFGMNCVNGCSKGMWIQIKLMSCTVLAKGDIRQYNWRREGIKEWNGYRRSRQEEEIVSSSKIGLKVMLIVNSKTGSLKMVCRGVVHTKSNGEGVLPTKLSLDALQTNSKREGVCPGRKYEAEFEERVNVSKILWWSCV